MENQQYLQAFLDESAENTQVLNTLCLDLEQGSRDDEIFAAMFRAAHTLKGMSATMGFMKMAALTHRLEDALGVLRKSPDLLTSEVVDVLFSGIDGLTANLDEIRATGNEENVDHRNTITNLTNQVLTQTESTKVDCVKESEPLSIDFDIVFNDNVIRVLQQCKASGIRAGILKVVVDPGCSMKGVRAVVIARAIDQFADCLQCQPNAIQMEEGAYESVLQFVVAIQHGTSKDLVKAVENVSEVSTATFSEISADALRKSTSEFHEEAIVSQPFSDVDNGKKQDSKQSDRVEKIDRTIRVSVDRLDTLMNQLSELVIDKTRLVAVTNRLDSGELRELSEHISRIATDIQSAVMSLRMVPVESLFQRFPRLIRDLAKSLGKKIHLEMTGLATELDRTVIDEMGEALVHLIRNAADHGLESPQERVKRGKLEEGTMFLRAYASGQNVFIEVADDGSGIDSDKIIKKAVTSKLITPDRASTMPRRQIFSLLFESGFSTADTVSDISGRGVGLDAVKRKVESLGGIIEIESEIGKGTTFQIRLPLTLAILQALLVEIDHETFAIPLASVEEVILADNSNLEHVHGHMALNLRGKLVSIVNAGDWLFNESSCKKTPWRLVVCKEGAKRIAIAVDSFHGQQEIVNKSLGTYLGDVREFSGATILGDGNIALILNIHEWINL